MKENKKEVFLKTAKDRLFHLLSFHLQMLLLHCFRELLLRLNSIVQTIEKMLRLQDHREVSCPEAERDTQK